MKGSVSEMVRQMVDSNPSAKKLLREGLLNCSSYARNVKNTVEGLVGKEVGTNTIVMALRRYGVELRSSELPKEAERSGLCCRITVNSGIADICIPNSSDNLTKLSAVYHRKMKNPSEFLNVSLGTSEVGIFGRESFIEDYEKEFTNTPLIKKLSNLTAFTLHFDDPILQNPGITRRIIQRFSWENINIFEFVSTLRELTFIVSSKDSAAALGILNSLAD